MKAQQLKNSILQYAMQGKLVEQDPNDEPASVLLEKIKEEKEQLIKDKVIKREKALSTITEDEIPFEIPDTWEWVKAQEVLDVRDGTHDTPKYVNEGIPLVTSKNLKNGKLVFDNIKYISEEDHFKIEQRSKVDDNDILFAMIGSIGNSVLVKKDISFSIKNVALFKQYPSKSIYMPFIYHLLNYFEDDMRKNASGGVQSFVSLTSLRNLIIPLPPLAEQQRIVEKIEELFEKVDEYDVLEQEISALNNAFPTDMEKSILQYAMQGKLVEQDSNDEPASVLLERIKEEKEQLIQDKVIKREKALPPINEDEIPFEIPGSWEWVRLKEICLINPKNKADDKSEAGFVPMKMIDDGLSNNHLFEKKTWVEIKKGYTHFQNNDIAIAKITPCFENKKSMILKDLPNNIGAGTTELFIVRSYNNSVNHKYLLYLFKNQFFINDGVKSFTGTAGQQRVSRTFLENYPVPLPPLTEQKRIVDKIEEMLRLTNRMKNTLNPK